MHQQPPEVISNSLTFKQITLTLCELGENCKLLMGRNTKFLNYSHYSGSGICYLSKKYLHLASSVSPALTPKYFHLSPGICEWLERNSFPRQNIMCPTGLLNLVTSHSHRRPLDLCGRTSHPHFLLNSITHSL